MRLPSSEMEIAIDGPAMLRARNTVAEDVSTTYTLGNPTRGTFTPAIFEPSREAARRLRVDRYGRPDGGGKIGTPAAGGVMVMDVSSTAGLGLGSYNNSTLVRPP